MLRDCEVFWTGRIVARLSRMMPIIDDIRPGSRSEGTLQCCWQVRYRFCGLLAVITVYAHNEADARANAVEQLRLRGLKIA
jgi:hypothetical protein